MGKKPVTYSVGDYGIDAIWILLALAQIFRIAVDPMGQSKSVVSINIPDADMYRIDSEYSQQALGQLFDPGVHECRNFKGARDLNAG
ncbi:MAG: hypothetical protein BGN84_15820 [Afipia sp. 62-7]|nr:MAG: hypothetical protein BGN84_15820 [Afipia sp. 62-7]